MSVFKNKRQWDFLKEIAKNKRIPQAIIFSGQLSLAKKETALEFIKFLNCSNKDFKKGACQNCLSCRLIEEEKHPDLIRVEPVKKEIEIDQIRDLQRNLSLKPQISSFKAVIIDKAETLNSESQNCLLKTLEEPKGNSLLILITSQPESLFSTIRSRCQLLKFYADSFSFRGSDTFKEIEYILHSDLYKRLSFFQTFFNKENLSKEADYFLEGFENYLRIILLKKLAVRGKELDSFSLKIPDNYSLLKIKNLIDYLSDLKRLISTTNLNPKLVLENLAIKI